MFKIDGSYSDYTDQSDPLNYPGGKAKDCSTPDSADGTPVLASWFNDIIGARQAIVKKAFGSLAGISGAPDNANKSDVLDAIEKLFTDADNALFEEVKKLITAAVSLVTKISEVMGAETVIPWAVFGMEYDSEKRYAVDISSRENYPEFLPFGHTVEADGIHIFPYRLVDGEIKNETRGKEWGIDTWGMGIWGAYSSMGVNIQVQEVA